MKYRILTIIPVIMLLAIFISGCSHLKSPFCPMREWRYEEYALGMGAEATLINSDGEEVGMIDLEETRDGLKIMVNITDLPPGEHALHIHEYAECDPPDFKSAGGHFNPFKTQHGFLNPAGPHSGDLPNFMVEEDGTANLTLITKRVTLRHGPKNSLFRHGGTSFVIHKNPDDYITDPAGMGGARIACGIIRRK